ncbi:unnamed protein product [Urochloa decumbens]|uniref:F-box domain-containing protein n=1 Tax=Urochloa decumbens TaxID=240449 RepID=A0ABC9B4Z5_9POAL
MPPKRKGGKGKRAAAPGAARVASLDVLPDEVLGHVLSFLPAQESVRTCVLARRWRYLWRSAPGLRILFDGEGERASIKELREFMDHMFLLRGASPLDTCHFSLIDVDDDDDELGWVNLWIRHVLMCRVQVLSLNFKFDFECWITRFYLDELPLVSQYLRRLELSRVQLNGSFVDFSRCPTLEVLEIKDSDILDFERILSQSLKSLSITGVCEFSDDERIHVCAPNLVSLRLEVCLGLVPILERMPSLVEADVEIDANDCAFCRDVNSANCTHCKNDGDTDSVLLQGLSEAQSLVLSSVNETTILIRGLKYCPIFRNLKTLLLNEHCCVPADFGALTSILEHSPILEKLTLLLFCKGPKSKVLMKGSPDPTERSNEISEHLKVVEVKCKVVDNRVLNVLEFLNKLGICFNFEEQKARHAGHYHLRPIRTVKARSLVVEGLDQR